MSEPRQIRWEHRFTNLENAWQRLQSACTQTAYSDLELAGLVHTFEFTFELSWKTMQDYLFFQGILVQSPRDAIRHGFAVGLIDNPELWLSALESRNRLTHTYDRATALEAESLIKHTYAALVGVLVETLRTRA